MNKKSLIATWIARCDEEIDEKCKGDGGCSECKYCEICLEVSVLNSEFMEKGYID